MCFYTGRTPKTTATDMSNNAAPDSWDETDVTDQSASDLQQKLTKLNVNAVEFVPSFTPFSAKSEDENNENDNVGGSDKKSTGMYGTGFKVMTCQSLTVSFVI